jgi:hypothetical protein
MATLPLKLSVYQPDERGVQPGHFIRRILRAGIEKFGG